MICTICLDNDANIYHSICNVCSNIVCNDCYNVSDIHNLHSCPACRTKLDKEYKIDRKVVLYFVFFYRHYFLHIIVNILFTNLTFSLNFPTENIDKIVPSNKTLFLLLLNYCNIIIVPTIYNSFKDYVYLNYIYTFFNFTTCQIMNITHDRSLGTLYNIYCILYLYGLCIIHITLIHLRFLVILFNISNKRFVIESNIYKLVKYNSYHNTRV